MLWARIGGAVLGLVLLLAPLAASGAETPVLTLKQLTVMALDYSHEIKATKSEVTLAQEQKNEVHGYRWPQFDALATGGWSPMPAGARCVPSVKAEPFSIPTPRTSSTA